MPSQKKVLSLEVLAVAKNRPLVAKKCISSNKKSSSLPLVVAVVAKLFTGCSFLGCKLQQTIDVVVAKIKINVGPPLRMVVTNLVAGCSKNLHGLQQKKC